MKKVIRCGDCENWIKTTLKYTDGSSVYDCPYWPEELYWADENNTYEEGACPYCLGAPRSLKS